MDAREAPKKEQRLKIFSSIPDLRHSAVATIASINLKYFYFEY